MLARVRSLRIAWEYFCSGLWEFDSEAGAWIAIEPEDLPISDRLRQSIRRWAAEQTEAYNGTEPVSDQTRAAWDAKAMTLAQRLSKTSWPATLRSTSS